MKLTLKLPCSKTLLLIILAKQHLGSRKIPAQTTCLRSWNTFFTSSLSMKISFACPNCCLHAQYQYDLACYDAKCRLQAEECLKREKERVGHYLHASSEQKLLEVSNLAVLEWMYKSVWPFMEASSLCHKPRCWLI
jgi:hypothetical protein